MECWDPWGSAQTTRLAAALRELLIYVPLEADCAALHELLAAAHAKLVAVAKEVRIAFVGEWIQSPWYTQRVAMQRHCPHTATGSSV